MKKTAMRNRVGEVRPTQLLFTFGVGAIVDLPNLSTMVMGIEEWDTAYTTEIGEERLLAAVKQQPGLGDVAQLRLPPVVEDAEIGYGDALDSSANVGVPVAPFPRWMRCPYCNLLAPLNSGLFDLKVDPFHPDRTRYIHANCPKPGKPPTVLPARFLIACENGHLDDFPWISYVHNGPACSAPRLRLKEYGVSGVAADVEVRCETCDAKRRLADAFSEKASDVLPKCRGRHPHLRSYAEDGCGLDMRAILLGASNSWFPMTLSVLSVPTKSGKLDQLVQENWVVLEKAVTKDVLKAFVDIGQLKALASYSLEEIWEAVEKKRSGASGSEDHDAADLKLPEWEVFAHPDPARNGDDFRLTTVDAPKGYEKYFTKTVLVERVREVRALVGFTRIESPGDFSEMENIAPERRAPLSRKSPRWVPASDVRGEGIFIEFDEEMIQQWCEQKNVLSREDDFRKAHLIWRTQRRLLPPEAGFPRMRFILLHSFAHALMRQLAIECGYTAASIRERIYSRGPEDENGPMAGVLLYTAAPDSEGTLGGLVSLGKPLSLGRLIDQALEQITLCASDPICAEHQPHREGITLHGAACHACLFAPETSCERGNKYLDRAVLIAAMGAPEMAFFSREDIEA